MGNFFHIPHGIGLNAKAVVVLLVLLSVDSFSLSISYSDTEQTDRNIRTLAYCFYNVTGSNVTFGSTVKGNSFSFVLPDGVSLGRLTSYSASLSSNWSGTGNGGMPPNRSANCSSNASSYRLWYSDIEVTCGYSCDVRNPFLGEPSNSSATVSCNWNFELNGLDCSGMHAGNYFLCPDNRPNPDCSSPVPISMEECKGGQGLILAGNGQQLDSAISGLNLGSDAAWRDYPLQNQLDTALSRPDGSVCSLGNASGQKFTRLVCPLGFEPDSTGECYIEPEPLLLRKGIRDRYETSPMPNYGLDWSSKSFYDARGRRTQAEPNTRRYLFSGEKNKPVVRETELGMESLLRNSPSGLCCVDSFSVKRRGDIDDASVVSNGKVGVEVDFYAEFGKGNCCNPECCEFKQESIGYILRNDSLKNETSCRIDGEYITYSDTEYVPDCYGRDCNNILESYNDTLGTYNGWDHPGLKSVGDSTSVDIRMEFNSYIEDKCSNPKEIKETRYWGFHIQGTPYYGLTPTLLGEINK